MKRLVLFLALAIALASHTALAVPERTHGGAHRSPEKTSESAQASEHANEGEESSEAGEHALKPINWTDVSNTKQVPYAIYLANFGILIFLYVYFGKKPVKDGLKARRDSIAKEIEEAQRMKKEAKARAKKYQAKLEGLDEELEAAKAGLIEAGKADKARIVREAEEKAARMNRDAKELLEQERRQLHDDLVIETVEAAVREAEELLKKRVMPEDHERLAEDFLAELAKRGTPSVTPAAPVNHGGDS